MDRRDFFKAMGSVGACAALPLGENILSGNEDNRPNVILIMGDDIGYGDIGCYGSEIDTRNLDQLGANGMRFTQFTNMAKCNPTRSSLFTGLFLKKQYSRNARSIGNLMRDAGYRTGMFGKEHFDGWVPKNCHAVNSFDESFIYSTINPYFKPPEGEFRNPFKYNGEKVAADDIPVSEEPFYKTDVMTDYALRFLENKKNKPFFLYLPYHSAHYPLQAREEDIEKYLGRYRQGWDRLREERFERQKEMGVLPPNAKLSPPEDNLYQHRGSDEWCRYDEWDTIPDEEKDELDREMAVYAAMVDRMDQNIGRVVDKVKAMGEMDNTLIIYLNDNGSCPYKNPTPGVYKNSDAPLGTAETYPYLHPEWACAGNTPWRYYKQYGHQGGAQTPFIAHWPEVIEKGQITHQVGSVVDILPTLLDIVNADYPAEANGKPTPQLDGKSLLPVFQGEKRKQPEIIISGVGSGKRMVRVGDWKIVRVKKRPWELYNMAEDPSELNNLADSKPQKVDEILAAFNEWKKREGVEWVENEDYTTLADRKKATARAEITVEEDTKGIIIEAGAKHYGLLLYIHEGDLYFQCGKGGEFNESGQVVVKAPISPGRHVVKWTADANKNKTVLYIDDEKVAESNSTIDKKLAGANPGGVGKAHDNRSKGAGSMTEFTGTIHSVKVWPGEAVFE